MHFIIVLFLISNLYSQDSEKRLKEHVYYLASDELEGRGTNSNGFDLAADYAIKNFEKDGLKAILKDGFIQEFILDDNAVSKLKNDQNKTVAVGKNVIAVLSGNDDKLKSSYIVISAHLDHKGKINGDIFNGANDNGTGSASVIELAHTLSQVKLKRSLLFVLFGAEEIGMIGSEYFVDHSPVDLKNIIVNINLDGIGAYVNQTDTTELLALGANRICDSFQNLMIDSKTDFKTLKLVTDDPQNFFFRSDQYRFHQKNIPAIMFTDYGNGNYHKTTDDAERLQYDHLEKLISYIHHLVVTVANRTANVCEND